MGGRETVSKRADKGREKNQRPFPRNNGIQGERGGQGRKGKEREETLIKVAITAERWITMPA